MTLIKLFLHRNNLRFDILVQLLEFKYLIFNKYLINDARTKYLNGHNLQSKIFLGKAEETFKCDIFHISAL